MPTTRFLAPLLALALLVGGFALAAPAEAGPGARDVALARILRTQRLKNVVFEDAALPDVLRWLRTATGKNILLKRKPLLKAGIDPQEIRVTATLEDVTVGTFLNLVLEPHDLAVQIKGNVVWITTHADSLGRPVTRLYTISHITWTKVDFYAPEINLRPSDYTPVDEYEPEKVVEDDPLTSGDAVVELLQQLVSPDDWDTAGWRISATDRYLIVRVPRSVHPRIERALRMIASMK